VRALRFITNGMLGKLTRWLRMLGHDVEYSGSLDDDKLIDRAKTEKRILLTRDLRLCQRAITQGANAFLVDGDTGTGKLAQLSKRFNFKLEMDVAISRCPKCNASIESVPIEKVIDRIPKATILHHNEFWKCQSCEQIYWRGSHWKRIEKTLREAKEML
jgi:uncharacterized protein with PIN domain